MWICSYLELLEDVVVDKYEMMRTENLESAQDREHDRETEPIPRQRRQTTEPIRNFTHSDDLYVLQWNTRHENNYNYIERVQLNIKEKKGIKIIIIIIIMRHTISGGLALWTLQYHLLREKHFKTNHCIDIQRDGLIQLFWCSISSQHHVAPMVSYEEIRDRPPLNVLEGSAPTQEEYHEFYKTFISNVTSRFLKPSCLTN